MKLEVLEDYGQGNKEEVHTVQGLLFSCEEDHRIHIFVERHGWSTPNMNRAIDILTMM